MNENYNQSYTRDEIAEYLNAVRECVEMEILRYFKAGQGKRMCILLGNTILDTKCKKIS